MFTGKFSIDNDEFEINNDFKQVALEVADALQIDELDAAQLVLQCEEESDGTPQSMLLLSASRFHERREVLLRDLSQFLRESATREGEDGEEYDKMRNFVDQMLEGTGQQANASPYTRKCIAAMADVEQSLVTLSEQTNKARVLGTEQAQFLLELIEVQRISLLYQHEALGTILCYLFRANHATREDFRKMIELAKKRDRFDSTILHYIPPLGAAIAQFGSADSTGNLSDVRSLYKTICSPQEGQHAQWLSHPFHSAVTLMWLAEYSSWYRETGRAIGEENIDLEKEAEERSKLMTRSLNDGALEFFLAICAVVRPEDRLDAARREILQLLLSDTNGVALDGDAPSEPFHLLLMETFETFSEAWITNMPDDIRRLKVEEDEQRLYKLAEIHGGMSQAAQHEVLDARLHLEALLVLMSFAYERRPEAADHFWGDPDGNLYGFLLWASRRQTVPRVSAFCELLCALAEGKESALSAHRFLLEESVTVANRSRKFPSMNYGQIVAELELYATKVNERPATKSPNDYRKKDVPDLNELESPVMLSCYLRLIAHMCTQAESARTFFLENKEPNFVLTILLLSSGPIPSYLRATVFKALEALLTDKSRTINNDIWIYVDAWASGILQSSISSSKTSQPQQSPKNVIRHTLDTISLSFDQANAFAAFIQVLMVPPADSSEQASLAFPEDLGSTYRMPGVEPYVDFVIGQLFAKRALELPEEGQIRSLQFNCINFIATCLESFNEKFVAIAHHPLTPATYAHQSSAVAYYTQRHPCTRVMEWMFNSDVVKCLLQAMHQDPTTLDSAASDSLIVILLERAVEVVNVVLELQPTYLDILRPATKKMSLQSTPVANSAIAAFEDAIVARSDVLSDLTLYTGTRHEVLALRSLTLIQALSNSRRLMSFRKGPGRSAFDILGASPSINEALSSLIPRLQVDVRELEHGPEAGGYQFKVALLNFLNRCLILSPTERSVAHVFLGFTAIPGSPYLAVPNGESVTVLHAVIGLAEDYPDEVEGSFMSWLMYVRSSAMEVLRRLFTCPPSSKSVISELRATRFLPSQFVKQQIVDPRTPWDGRMISHRLFWLTESAVALSAFLRYRSFLYEYAVTEIRSVTHSKLPSLQRQILSTMMGKSKLDDEVIEHPAIFELFDFANLDLGPELLEPEVSFFANLDLASCLAEGDYAEKVYDIEAVEELLSLRVEQLKQEGRYRPGENDEHVGIEHEALLTFIKAQNQRSAAQAAYSRALRMWTKMVTVTLESSPMTEREKVQFHLQAFQVVLPKLDYFLLDSSPRALDLATMTDSLSASLGATEDSLAPGLHDNAINDRFFQLFRIMLQGIYSPDVSTELREVSYNLCSRYLDRILGAGPVATKARAHSLEAIKSAGTRLLTVMCDDADVGEGPCRLSALVALNAFARLGKLEKSSYMIETLVYFNFLEVLIDPIKSIATDLQETEASGLSSPDSGASNTLMISP